jgi:hypothetical protein
MTLQVQSETVVGDKRIPTVGGHALALALAEMAYRRFCGTGMPAERSRHETAGMARPGESARSLKDPVALAEAELASLRAAQQRIADHTDGRSAARAEPGQYPATTRPESAPSTSFHPGRGTHPKGSHARTHLSSTAPAGVPSASEVRP